MFRYILPALGLVIILASIIYFLIFFDKPTAPAMANTPSTETLSSSPVPLELPVTSSPLPANAAPNEKLLESKIKTLETSVTGLTGQVTLLSQKYSQLTAGASATPASTATANSQPAVYVTLGSNGELNDQGYTPIPGFVASLNPADFPGYTNVILEATVSRVQPGGTANLQLFNQNTGQGISASTLTASNTSFQLYSSSPFQLNSGTNTYVLSLLSSDNTNVQVGVARLKINFD
jgi:hypothetical protein